MFGLGELLILGVVILVASGGSLVVARQRMAAEAEKHLKRRVESAVPPGVRRVADEAKRILAAEEAEEVASDPEGGEPR